MQLARRQWAEYARDWLADARLKRHLNERDIQCLRSTRVPMWRIEFALSHRGDPDPASALLLTDRDALPASLNTLQVQPEDTLLVLYRTMDLTSAQCACEACV